ncbi:MAG: homocysteine S-methyltransferase family protein [Lentisphaeria bacterium]
MTRQEFAAIATGRILILDGATGTELIKRGMPSGVSPENWILEHPEAILEVQKNYVAAGSDIIYVPSFGGNRLKLKEFNLADKGLEINRKLAELSRQAAPQGLIFGDLAPTGQFVEPSGDLPFEESVAIYREQAQGLLAGGVDGFVIETMMDVQEARAALLAIRELCDLPVMVTLTFEAGKRTLAGNDPVAALVTLQALGADAFGCNCSSGPESMAEIIAMMKPYAKIPLIAKPNAGLPQFRAGQTVFPMGAEEFGSHAATLVAAGASMIGGCCGSSSAHIAALSATARRLAAPSIGAQITGAVSSARAYRVLNPKEPFTVLGERINPTGKKALQAELRAGKLDLVQTYAEEQEKAGAALLEVNVGLSGIDETKMMREAVLLLARSSTLPLCIDTTKPETAEAALRIYPGRALFNSISAEPERLKKVLPLAAKYGAMLILLPLTEAGIPETLEKRCLAVEQILKAAEPYGYSISDVCVDGLVMTISSDPRAAQLTLDLLSWCSKRGMNTVCGLSNVSFGLPRRDLVNQAFLGMAIGNGLNMAIANPMQTELMDLVRAGDALSGRDPKLQEFCRRYAGSSNAAAPATQELSPNEALLQALLQGNAGGINGILAKALSGGASARELVDHILIPGISEVGARFERKEYFLPQLIMSADVMQAAMAVLQPMLEEKSSDSKGKILLATVKGDVHDIGKNIVAIMLKNYGFEIFDLGKDVSAESILDTAQRENIRLVGLSALMTTTMMEMKTVIELARQRGQQDLQFMVGGAVLDEAFAQSIGAHYAADALSAVKLAQRLLPDSGSTKKCPD